MLSRRRFLALSSFALSAPALRAIETFQRTGAPRLRLSLAAYSFRDSFKEQQGKVNPKGTLEMPGFIDYCGRARLRWRGADELLLPERRHGRPAPRGAPACLPAGGIGERNLGGQ
jgi:hypothetical protein